MATDVELRQRDGEAAERPDALSMPDADGGSQEAGVVQAAEADDPEAGVAQAAEADDQGAGVARVSEADDQEARAVRAVEADDQKAGVVQAAEMDDGAAHPLAQDLLLHPHRWRLWSAVAILRWVLRGASSALRGLMYRSRPTLRFSGAEIEDVAFEEGRVDLILSAPGLVATGTSLPSSDVARIVRDSRPPGRGALAAWLDGPGDRFMQALEIAEARNNAAFALATGGRIEALRLVAELVGRSAPLEAVPGGVLSIPSAAEPDGAIGLAGLFVGPVSAAGLATLVSAFTGLPATVEEFSGARVTVLRPSRVGAHIGRILGASCELPAAGVAVVIDGGEETRAQEWGWSAVRRRSLFLLCQSYIGGLSHSVRIYLELAATNAPPAILGGPAAFGGLAVLGPAAHPVRLPLHG